MDYIRNEENEQVVFEQSVNDLRIPCCLYGFTNTGTTKEETACGRGMFCFYGKTELGENDRICPECGRRMHINDRKEITLRHLPFGGTRCCVRFPHIQLRCPKCKATKMQYIAFQAEELAWMAHVEAVACDMNSDFQEAFEESCPHIQPVLTISI